MSQRFRPRESLPFESGYNRSSIPPYLTNSFDFNNNGTGSTGSMDSIATQVPLPYHMSEFKDGDDSGGGVSINGSNRRGEETGGYGMSLHPAAASNNGNGGQKGFVQSYAWQTPDLSRSNGFENYSHFSQQQSSTSASTTSGQVDNDNQNGRTSSLNPTSTPYVPVGMNGSGAVNSLRNDNFSACHLFQANQAVSSTSNPYASSFETSMNIGGPVGGYSNSRPGAQSSDIGMGIPVIGYADPRLPHLQYQNQGQAPNPYSHFGIAVSESALNSFGAAMKTGNGFANHYPNQFNGQYGSISANMYPDPANANRGKPSFTPEVRPNGGPVQSPPPAFTSPPQYGVQSQALRYPAQTGADPQYNNGNTQVQASPTPAATRSQVPQTYGGPVQAPTPARLSTVPEEPLSPSASTSHESSYTSSSDAPLEMPANHQRTPAAKAIEHNFQSEPRATKTPTLRSRRGQTISGASVSTATWLENIASGTGNENRVPPPATPSLTGAVLESSAVAIKESIKSPPQQGNSNQQLTLVTQAVRGYTNPFAPTPSHLAPLNQDLPPYWVDGITPASQNIKELTRNGSYTPTYDEATADKYFPFMEIGRAAKPHTYGVIKLSNIPYSLNRSEILAVLGRNARIVNEFNHEPIHIVMERVTCKTLDCYVEFISFNEAVNAVNRFEQNKTGGRGSRLGSRYVEVELSSQDELMKELFPKAKNTTWKDGMPIIAPRDLNDRWNSGFQGFISSEELVMMVKHVEVPSRSPFSKECPQRSFECLISTLVKYPWYMVDYITLDDVNRLFQTTMTLLHLLQERVEAVREDISLTPMLYKRVWRAAVKCPGFTPAMKWYIWELVDFDEQTAIEMGIPQFAQYWDCFWTIAPKPNIPQDLVMWFAGLIREQTQPKHRLTLAERAARGGETHDETTLFGNIKKLYTHHKYSTLAQIASAEWAAIEKVLRECLA